MRPYTFYVRMHGIECKPWTGPGAWWKSPRGGASTVFVAIPVHSLLAVLFWLEWWFTERRELRQDPDSPTAEREDAR